jgi:hypothetical protein
MKIELYHVCSKNPEHKAWGIYRRNKKRIFNLFRLVTICLDYDNAIKQAEALAKQDPDKDFTVQGAKYSNHLPDDYKI